MELGAFSISLNVKQGRVLTRPTFLFTAAHQPTWYV